MGLRVSDNYCSIKIRLVYSAQMFVSCRGKDFEVYTPEEADYISLSYKNDWRKAKEGDWIITSDNKVIKVIGNRTDRRPNGEKKTLVNGETKIYPRKDVSYIRTGYGETPTYKRHIYAHKGKDPTFNREDYKRRIKPTTKQLLFAENLVSFGKMDNSGMWDITSIIAAYQSAYRDNNPDQSLRRGLRVLKKELVQKHMSNKMKDVLQDKGMDDVWVADKLENIAENSDSDATKLNAVNRVSELLGHNLKTEKINQQSFTVQIAPAEMKKLKERREKHAELLSADDEILEAVFLEVEKRRKISTSKDSKT